MGIPLFRKGIESRTFQFLHLKRLLCYTGQNGLDYFRIDVGDKAKWQWWQEALFGSPHDAIELQLRYMCSSLDRKERVKLVDAILVNMREVPLENDFGRAIKHETYSDVLGNQQLSSIVTRRSSDLDHLPGLQTNQIRVLGVNAIYDDAIRDEINLVLKVAEVNLEIYLSTVADDADPYTSEGAQQILRGKLLRHGFSREQLKGFLSLLDLNRLPDIGVPVENGELTFTDIWKIRNKRSARLFRKWLREANIQASRDIERKFVEDMGRKGLVESLPLRVLRFAIVTGVGVINIPAGLVVSTIDSFFVERWFKGYSPKLFIDELQKFKLN
jgi:hypothetical protein